MQEDNTKMKLKFTRIMRELCGFMSEVNKDDNIELVYKASDDAMCLYRTDITGRTKRKMIDRFAAPVNFYTEE